MGVRVRILNKFLAQMRDKKVQADSMRFRRNMERVAEIMAYEISKRLNYKTRMVETPLGVATVEEISDKVVIATILRAGSENVLLQDVAVQCADAVDGV